MEPGITSGHICCASGKAQIRSSWQDSNRARLTDNNGTRVVGLVIPSLSRQKQSGASLNSHSQLYPIVRRMHQILLRSQVPLSRLDGSVPEKQLDLLKLAAGSPAHLRAGPAKVVGRNSRRTNRDRILLEELPDDFLAQGKAANSVGTIY